MEQKLSSLKTESNEKLQKGLLPKPGSVTGALIRASAGLYNRESPGTGPITSAEMILSKGTKLGQGKEDNTTSLNFSDPSEILRKSGCQA
jgi:hypothetical protein